MRARVLSATLAVSLVLAACGGDDGDAAQDAIRQMQEALEDAGLGSIDLDDLDLDDAGMPDDTFGDSGPTEIEPPVFFLTDPADPPAGWVFDPAQCSADDELGPPQMSYYVPGDWTRRGSGYGGSGFEGSGNHDYELPDGGEIEIDTSTDSYWMGEVMDASGGEPWTTWDYDITEYSSSGERSERIEYAQLAPVEIDGQQVDFFYLDATRFELESQSKYKARVVFADLPSGGFGQNNRNPGSVTVTVTWNPERVTPDEQEIRTILSTMRIEPCVVDGYLEYYSLIFGADWSS